MTNPALPVDVVGVALLGLMLGSFATALIHRIPSGVSWSFPGLGKTKGTVGGSKSMPRSACPHCGATLAVIDLIPLFSWLFLRGKCRRCHAPIGWLYPVVECVSALGCLGLYAGWGLSVPSALAMVTVPFLLALMVIDIKYLILPDSLNALLAVLWVIFAGVSCVLEPDKAAILHYALMGAIGGLVYGAFAFLLGVSVKFWLKKEALGLGDVKFFAVAGLWLGVGLLPPFMIMAGVLGVLMGLIYRIIAKEAYFPFGPALIVAFYVLLLVTPPGFLV